MVFKSNSFYALFILLFIMLGCSEIDFKDNTDKIDQSIIQYLYYSGGIEHAYLFNNNEMVIVSEENLFYTNNLLHSYKEYPIGFINETLTPTFTEQNIIFQNVYSSLNVQVFNKKGTVSTIDIQKSNSWYHQNPSATNPGILRDGSFLSEKLGWILNSKDGTELVLEKYADGKSEEIYQFPFSGGRIKFYDESFGYAFLPEGYFSSYYIPPGNVYMATTSDGGYTWTDPKFIGVDIDIWDIKMLSKEALIIKQEYDGKDFLYTKDGGSTWTKVVIPSGYTLEQIVSCDLAIIKKEGIFSLYDANNGEIMVNLLPAPFLNQSWNAKVSFISADTGIIYNELEMYITYDRGQNWKELIQLYQ